jgi:transposase
MLDMLRKDYDAVRVESEGIGFKGRKARVVAAIASLYRGMPLEEVAKVANVMPGTVRRWADAFSAGGLDDALAIAGGQTYTLRSDFDAQTLRLAAETAIYPGQKARLLAIASMYDGVSTKEIVRMTSVSATTLAIWREEFNRRGLEHEYEVPDTHLQANFKAGNRLFPLARVLKLRRKSKTPEMNAKLDVIILSYRGRSVEMISEQKGASKALVASWIKAFNASGPSALDPRGDGVAVRTGSPSHLDLPSEYSAESLREAAMKMTSDRARLRLFSLATLYEMESFNLAASQHHVNQTSVRNWLEALRSRGVDGVAQIAGAHEPIVFSPEEVEKAVASARSKRDGNLVKAVVDVLAGGSAEEAATRWVVNVLSVKRLVPRVRANGLKVFAPAIKPVEISTPAWKIREIAASAPETHREIAMTLAELADGADLSEVLRGGVSRDDLVELSKAITRGKLPWTKALKAAEMARETEADAQRLEDSEQRAASIDFGTVFASGPKKPTDHARAKVSRRLAAWKAAETNPFLSHLRDLLLIGFQDRNALATALNECGIPQDLFEQWETKALLWRGISPLGLLGSTPTFPWVTDALMDQWSGEIAKEKDWERRRRMAGVVARLEGAVLPIAALIGGLETVEIKRLVSIYIDTRCPLASLPLGSEEIGELSKPKRRATVSPKPKSAVRERKVVERRKGRKLKWQAYLNESADMEPRRPAKSHEGRSPHASLSRSRGEQAKVSSSKNSTRKAGRFDVFPAMRRDFNGPHFAGLLKFLVNPLTIQKYKVLQLAYTGMTIAALAEALTIEPQRVKAWIDAFNEDGLVALANLD